MRTLFSLARLAVVALPALLAGVTAMTAAPPEAGAQPATASAAADSPIRVPTPSQLAVFPRMQGFRLSPDGKHLLAVESQGDTRTVVVWKTDDITAKPRVIGSTAMQIQGANFVKNDMLEVTMAQPLDVRVGGVLTKTFVNKLLITDLDGKTWKEPLA